MRVESIDREGPYGRLHRRAERVPRLKTHGPRSATETKASRGNLRRLATDPARALLLSLPFIIEFVFTHNVTTRYLLNVRREAPRTHEHNYTRATRA